MMDAVACLDLAEDATPPVGFRASIPHVECKPGVTCADPTCGYATWREETFKRRHRKPDHDFGFEECFVQQVYAKPPVIWAVQPGMEVPQIPDGAMANAIRNLSLEAKGGHGTGVVEGSPDHRQETYFLHNIGWISDSEGLEYHNIWRSAAPPQTDEIHYLGLNVKLHSFLLTAKTLADGMNRTLLQWVTTSYG